MVDLFGIVISSDSRSVQFRRTFLTVEWPVPEEHRVQRSKSSPPLSRAAAFWRPEGGRVLKAQWLILAPQWLLF